VEGQVAQVAFDISQINYVQCGCVF